MAAMLSSPGEPPGTAGTEWTTTLSRMPEIWKGQSFLELVRTLAAYLSETVDVPHTFEQLRTGLGAPLLMPLTEHLSTQHHPNLVAALLILKWHYSQVDSDDRGIHATRANACEIVAWRFLSHLSEREVLDHLLYELVPPGQSSPTSGAESPIPSRGVDHENGPEWAGLLHGVSPAAAHAHAHFGGVETPESLGPEEEDPTTRFVGLNPLEIAVVVGAKKFLMQRRVQTIVNEIWCGDIVFWDSLNVRTKKKAQRYVKWKTDPYARLRVPMYGKAFEALFTASFLGLYYAVLFERNEQHITPTEIFLYIWIAAFAYDEFGEYWDTGLLFYTRDFWNYWDLGVLVVGVVFLITRLVGLARDSKNIVATSFDILSLAALFLVPRLFSLLSLNSYYGVIFPCLKAMTRDFVKFFAVVVLIYFAFLTTFTMLARDKIGVGEVAWTLLEVFFGASAIGFDFAPKVSYILGAPLMFVFACLTNILLITSLISLLSSSLMRVMDHAREEYVFQYSVFVLDAAASKRLTFFIPPLNLLPLVLLRPLRLFLSAPTIRSARIWLLRATHLPFVAAIWAYESLRERWRRPDPDAIWSARPPSSHHLEGPTMRPRTQSMAHSLGRPRALRTSVPGRRPTLAALTNKSEVSLVRPGLGSRDPGDEIDELRGAVERLTSLVEALNEKVDRVGYREGDVEQGG